MRKILLLLVLMSVLMLNACNAASIKARDHLYGYLESGDFLSDSYEQNDGMFEDTVFGGFSNFGYATEDYLELRYLRNDISAIIIYYYEHNTLDSGLIELSVESVEIHYRNIETDEYLRIFQDDINDMYQMTEDEFEAFNIMLYELRLKDILWILDALGYELM